MPGLCVGLFVIVRAAYGFQENVKPLCGPYKEELKAMQLDNSGF